MHLRRRFIIFINSRYNENMKIAKWRAFVLPLIMPATLSVFVYLRAGESEEFIFFCIFKSIRLVTREVTRNRKYGNV